jgi:tetratricopeptide (TPR) repeat protein
LRPAQRALLALVVALVAARPALAVQDWYDYYLQARDRDIPGRKWADCVKNLRAALRLRPAPGAQLRTYGVEFVDYLPHYHMGICLLRQESYDEAIKEFTTEESLGVIKRTPQRSEVVRLRAEAQSAWAALAARRARGEVDRLLREAQDFARRKAWDESLARLVQAEAIAKALDAETLRRVAREQERVRSAERDAVLAIARSQRLEQRIADGQRLLQEGKPGDAKLAFDEAYEIDPRDQRALDGRAIAQERILGTTTREKRKKSLAAGRALFDAGQYEQALGPLTDAAADPEYFEARALIARARQVVDGLRRQKELRAEIERLMARGEGLMTARSFPEAAVAFESVLRLDSGHARARARMEEAERRTGEAMFARWLPNQSPMLTLLHPEAEIVEAPTISVQGVATDDRGIQRVEFRVGDRLVAQDAMAEPPPRSVPFVKELPLEPGPNRVTVTAIDTGGLSYTVPYLVERRLRFHETRYFLPSALASAVTLVGVGWGAQRLRRRRAQRLRFNPYIAGAPVLDDQMFYGREKLTARMLSTLHRNSLMITGERRIGKTTFLHHLKRALEDDDAGLWKFFPVFVDLQGVPEQAFFQALIAEVVDALALTATTHDALRFRPDEDRYEARDFSHDLPLVLAELKTRTEKKVKLALLIDEVDVLNEYSESVNQRLRGIFMKSFSENLVAVMSGVAIRRRWKSEVSPWYNFFDEIELTPFTREEAEALVREPVAAVFRFQPEAVDRILELSQLRPYLVQKYCVHAVARMLEEGRSTIRLADVEAARAAVEIERRPERLADAAEARPVAD